MKQVLIKKGKAIVAEVPTPQVVAGEVLVRVAVSSISAGTELSNLQGSAMSMWRRALTKPEKILIGLQMFSDRGLEKTVKAIKNKASMAYPAGYSAAGEIVAIGSGIKDLEVGQRVACAGGQYANHAEYIRVARNLCAPVPNDVDWDSASTVTLGAIALQGIRRAQPTLGETFVVIGLGILGQITVQMLKANGCKVIGSDIDPSRIAVASSFGMDCSFSAHGDDLETVFRLTDGYGADGVIITAASKSDEAVSSAFKICRKKGRVVLVGDVGLNLNRSDFYIKEIDFLISSSYGPGRYDQRYEEQGLDYPIGYVRWTENRNMAEYLRLIDKGLVNITRLVSARFPVEDVENAYIALGGSEKPLLVLLNYLPENIGPISTLQLTHKSQPCLDEGRIRIAVVGAGSFAQFTHLPNLQSLSEQFRIRAIVSRTGPNAKAMGEQFHADYVSTDSSDIFSDPEVDAVLIATRHHLHGSLALSALKAGKHVLVEKPLTLDQSELDAIKRFFLDDTNLANKPIILTGYNRRFSPHGLRMKKLLAKRNSPFILNYRMNAGYISKDHWVHGAEGGGRNLGEACHIYDLFLYLADSSIESVSVDAVKSNTDYYGRNDNFIATFKFIDGSLATLTYTAMGHKDFSKETAELYVDGKIAHLDDYKNLTVYGAEHLSLKLRIQDKGLKNELMQFAFGIKSGEFPIPWHEQVAVCEVGFLIEEALSNR